MEGEGSKKNDFSSLPAAEVIQKSPKGRAEDPNMPLSPNFGGFSEQKAHFSKVPFH